MKSSAQKLFTLWRLSFQVSMPTLPSLALATGYERNGCFMNISYSIMARASRVKSSHCHPILCSIQASTSRWKWKWSKILTLRSMAVMLMWNIDAYWRWIHMILHVQTIYVEWLRWSPLSYEGGSRNCRLEHLGLLEKVFATVRWKKPTWMGGLDMIGPYKSRLKVESFESPSPRVNFAAEILGSLKLAV